MRISFILLLLISVSFASAQKKPLDHSVYDAWESIGERMISKDGKWTVYTIIPQEGDGNLFVQSLVSGVSYKKQIPRGYLASITHDSRFLVFRIKPAFQETRAAKLKKKRPEDYPKDSIGILELGKDSIYKRPLIKSFKTPAKASGWVAYLKERETSSRTPSNSQRTIDSLRRRVDSLTLLVQELRSVKNNKDGYDAEDDPGLPGFAQEGTDLILLNLVTGKEKKFKNVSEYYFNEGGHKLLMKQMRPLRDSMGANAVVIFDLLKEAPDTILKGGNDFRQFALSEDGRQIAFLAERDTGKSLQKFYGLYYYEEGADSAALLIDKKSVGMQIGMTVSEHGGVQFSKSGKRLFFGTHPIYPTRDTSVADIDKVKLDIWHHQDDYLQSTQLARLSTESKRSYLALYDFVQHKVEQLGNPGIPIIMQTNEGDGKYFIAVTDTGRRVASQWMGRTKNDVYALHVDSNKLTLIKKNHNGMVYPSATGNYILLYDLNARHYFAWNGRQLKNISAAIKQPLFNEENDVPAEPSPYGIMGWHEGDSALYVYTRYDVWKINPENPSSAKALTSAAAFQPKHSYRYLKLDPEERFIRHNQLLHFRLFDHIKKNSSLVTLVNSNRTETPTFLTEYGAFAYNTLIKADSAWTYLYSQENFRQSPDLFHIPAEHTDTISGWKVGGHQSIRLTQLNTQQKDYNWGSGELVHWKAYNGKPASGILYKPEDFDPSKKYPVLIYFYERYTDNLNRYYAPAPSASSINIPFFVSRGYLVFIPDIHYTKGHPGKDAYNYIVSGADMLAGKSWVDAKNMGIQGQSWGGYQVAYLITATNKFKAAWAGAPVANMFSAYGGIRWGTGLNRQFQYERGQSRIAATPWEKPELYIENSPLFHLQKVKTPLVIMHNDKDDAVPWYQGIELFTAMRRLGKQVWMLNYNDEVHNLQERKNRKDISIRLQQYFDWLLKGETAPRWIVEGIPAIRKGMDWGL